jgi:SAM-dependent methyltransferase
VAERQVVATEEAPLGALEEIGQPAAGAAGVLRHERVPFVSYPYEWTFGMLRDAALVQLDVLLAALDAGLTLKDGSPYNVQWRGADPVFIDLGSFEPWREGEPWAGYRQFCMLFLYPLLLQAYRGVDLQPLLRGSLDGIAPPAADRMFSLRDHFRRGVFTHVHLHGRLERRYEKRTSAEVRGELKRSKLSPEVVRANAKHLRKLVGRLEWKPGRTAWTAYRETSTYTDEAEGAKRAFVSRAAGARRGSLVWDLGCNDGAYARLAAEHASYVVAVDSDSATVDGLYRALRDESAERILPLVVNLADPSPGLGWRGRERLPLEARGRPGLTLALALVHHLAITANVPLAEVIDWLRSLDGSLVVEFPTREDPMVKRLLASKAEGLHPDYELGRFEQLLSERFRVERRQELPGGTRVLYEAEPA